MTDLSINRSANPPLPAAKTSVCVNPCVNRESLIVVAGISHNSLLRLSWQSPGIESLTTPSGVPLDGHFGLLRQVCYLLSQAFLGHASYGRSWVRRLSERDLPRFNECNSDTFRKWRQSTSRNDSNPRTDATGEIPCLVQIA